METTKNKGELLFNVNPTISISTHTYIFFKIEAVSSFVLIKKAWSKVPNYAKWDNAEK